MSRRKFVLLVAVAACGGGRDTGPISTQRAEEACQVLCERDGMCVPDASPVAQCLAACTERFTGGGFRADAIDGYVDCVADLTCAGARDACLTTCSPTSAHESYEGRCRSKLVECYGAENEELDFELELCETTPEPGDYEVGFLCLFTPQVMNELSACFEMTCTEINACLHAVFTKYGLRLGS